jgi:hypothetical protein
MITYGQKPNPSRQSYFSLGSVATGNAHVFTRYRTAADGASLHPLQRQGQVSAAYHLAHGAGRMTALGPSGIGDGPPAAAHVVTFPPVITIPGTARDPNMRI